MNNQEINYVNNLIKFNKYLDIINFMKFEHENNDKDHYFEIHRLILMHFQFNISYGGSYSKKTLKKI